MTGAPRIVRIVSREALVDLAAEGWRLSDLETRPDRAHVLAERAPKPGETAEHAIAAEHHRAHAGVGEGAALTATGLAEGEPHGILARHDSSGLLDSRVEKNSA